MDDEAVAWASERLDRFMELRRSYTGSPIRSVRLEAMDSMLGMERIIRGIADKLDPHLTGSRVWPQQSTDRVDVLSDVARSAQTILESREEIEKYLGTPAPKLSSDLLHPWVWGAAQTLWESGHYRDAIHSAARAVNAHAQTKIGRRDVNEDNLMDEAFSLIEPTATAPRLRIVPDDGSDTFRSVHIGAMNFGKGCFMALRNPVAHEHSEEEMEPHMALEQLASWSVLARWIDDAEVIAV